MDNILLSYKITFETWFHIGSGLAGGLLDALVRRDTHGNLVIPGSTLKGLIRENCEHLAKLCDLPTLEPHVPKGELIGTKNSVEAYLEQLCNNHNIIAAIFGSPFKPGTVYFSDAYLTSEWQSFFTGRPGLSKTIDVHPRTRLRLSRRTRTAQSKGLFHAEYAPAQVTFAGQIQGSLGGLRMESMDLTYNTLVLIAGVLLIERIGCFRSAGCGRCRVELAEDNISGQIQPYFWLNGQQKPLSDCLSYLSDLEYYQIIVEEGGI